MASTVQTKSLQFTKIRYSPRQRASHNVTVQICCGKSFFCVEQKHCTSTGCPLGPYLFCYCVSHKVMCPLTDVTLFCHSLVYPFKIVSLKKVTVISINYVGALRTRCIVNVVTETAEHQHTASRYTRILFRNSGPI